jgi:hypothetical protein
MISATEPNSRIGAISPLIPLAEDKPWTNTSDCNLNRMKSLNCFAMSVSYDVGLRGKGNFGDLPRMKLPLHAMSAVSTSGESPPKRRRFQRRNSQTAAMLTSAFSQVVESVKENPDNEGCDEKKASRNSGNDTADGLEIAQDLVRQLKLRNRKLAASVHQDGASTRLVGDADNR